VARPLLYPDLMLHRLPIVALFGIATLGALTAADAKGKGKQVRYVGVHPIPKAKGGGVCHIEAPHVHVYSPSDVKVQYRVHDDAYYFVGDPVAYGWDGPKHSYYGHHPVAIDVVLEDEGDHTEYCYLDGPHYHYYAPPPSLRFEIKGGAAWYVGDMPPAYVEARAELDPIDVVYEPIVYERPVVVVDAQPAAWVGLRYAVVAPAVEVRAPVVVARPAVRAHVDVVVPTVQVDIGIGGGIFVDGHSHGRGHGHFKGKGKGHWKRGKSSGGGGGVRVRDHRR
jgi:hypothetical protein